MAEANREQRRVMRVQDLYIAIARSMEVANRALEEGAHGEVSYAVVDSQVSVAYVDIAESEGEIVVRLPERGEPVESSRYLRFTIKPIPKPAAEDEKQPERFRVPNVVNSRLDEALTTLIVAGYRVGEIATLARDETLYARLPPRVRPVLGSAYQRVPASRRSTVTSQVQWRGYSVIRTPLAPRELSRRGSLTGTPAPPPERRCSSPSRPGAWPAWSCSRSGRPNGDRPGLHRRSVPLSP